MEPSTGETGLPSPPESSTSEPTRKETTGEYLENLSQRILEINLNVKDNMSPVFRGKHGAVAKAENREDHQANLTKHLQKQPDFRVEILNKSSEVDESRGRGTVFLWYEIMGLEHGLEREAVAVLSWERKQGNWMIMKHSGMRGPSGFS